MRTAELIEALRDPAAYPGDDAGPVTLVQTNISMLLFTADRVYKIQKPVDLGFLYKFNKESDGP